jgi:large subunit ribosomal protein L25
MMEVEVECLPKNIPQYIEVDLSEMHLNDIIHLTDLKLPEGVEILALKHGDVEDHDSAVANIHIRKVVEEVEEVEAAAEGEEGAEAAGEEAAKDEGGEES